MRAFALATLLLATSSIFAAPAITSIAPNVGSTAGGERVQIHGTGFSNNCVLCSPPFGEPSVFFGSTPAKSVTFVSPTLLEAVTPPHLPETVPVTVRNLDGSDPAFVPNAFTFSGEPTAGLDALLFPIFLPPTDGAFGSRFVTDARVFNATGAPAYLYGIDTNCLLISPTIRPLDPVDLNPTENDVTLPTNCSQSVGRIFYVTKGGRIAANLRVTDVTRQAQSHGVEVPVVRESELTQDRIALLNVPTDPKYRLTLRIYSLKPTDWLVDVAINGIGYRQVKLQPGRDQFEPWVGVISDWPTREQLGGASSMRVTLGGSRGPNGQIEPGTPKIWAFLSVTNNETQNITLITP